MSQEPRGEEEVNESLVDQLGTDPVTKARNQVDQVKLTYNIPSEKLTDQHRAVLYGLLRYDVVTKRKRFWKALADNHLRLLTATNGRGQDMLVKAESVKRGVPVSQQEAPKKPSILDRMLGREEVQEYELWKEKKEMGLL